VIVPSVVLTSYTIIYIKNRIIKPIETLVEEAQLISSGDLSHPIVYSKKDEIGSFVSAFDHMRNQLYEQQQQQRQFEIQRKNSISSISHDLKTPIASISAYVEALQDDLAETPEEKQQYLKIIENKLAVLADLSKQLNLSYATPEALNLSLNNFSCYTWTEEMICSVESECKIRGIHYSLHNLIEEDDKIMMLIDVFPLDRAIQNILSNCYRYTKTFFMMSMEIKEHNFILTIKNDGVTMHPSHVSKIFDRFYSEEMNSAQGHLGLGLYISKTIINAMMGDIQVDIDGGIITFEIALPVTIYQ
jgi:signal transduction histidine kinase